MNRHLVIVESPAKAKTIGKYLGADFHVCASYGHVRDLVPKEGAVDTEHDFAMKYEIIEKNQKHIDAIAREASRASVLFLATDPDREGEAISWHIHQILHERNLLGTKPVHRVIFHEITKHAVTDAIAHPKILSEDLINAQQARRALDYLVGFKLSPLLWKKIRRGLSAGRVQSPALRMIVEREIEIEQFVIQEYWTVHADSVSEGLPFQAKLTHFESTKCETLSIATENDAIHIRDTLLREAEGRLKVLTVVEKERKRNPSAPFTTSTLQQEAARKLGFTTKKTMLLAQQLYEGIDLGGESLGLITYMRTDSVTLSVEAIKELRELIEERFGKTYLPSKPPNYKTKSKNAQEAHEAIRPTSAFRIPEEIKPHLTADQYKLYALIWKRTVACQMIHATMSTVAVDLACGEKGIFRANGSTVTRLGFMSVYLEGKDDVSPQEEEDGLLPPLKKGQYVDLKTILAVQHFTDPPPRYTEASLVKTLEEYGIGRPSTYAAIISTLQQRRYVELKEKRFYPTDVGQVVNKFLTEHFDQYVDYHFTARLEDDLDAVSRGEKEWIPLMHAFWDPFKSLIEEKNKSVQRADVTQEPLDEACPLCGARLSIRLGRNGRFIGCTQYPECKYTRNKDGEVSEESSVETIEGRNCPKCDSSLMVKKGRYGRFVGCSSYPECKHIEPLEKPEDTGVVCPECTKGTLVKKKSRFGTAFYSCSTYPVCKHSVSHLPIAEPCPQCTWPILTLKVTKRYGTQKACPRKECGYTLSCEDTPDS